MKMMKFEVHMKDGMTDHEGTFWRLFTKANDKMTEEDVGDYLMDSFNDSLIDAGQ